MIDGPVQGGGNEISPGEHSQDATKVNTHEQASIRRWRFFFIAGLIGFVVVTFLVIGEKNISLALSIGGLILTALNLVFGSSDDSGQSQLRKWIRRVLSVNSYSKAVTVALFILSAALIAYKIVSAPPPTYPSVGYVYDAAGHSVGGFAVTFETPARKFIEASHEKTGKIEVEFTDADLAEEIRMTWIDISNNHGHEELLDPASIRGGKIPDIHLPLPPSPFSVAYMSFADIAASYIADARVPPDASEIFPTAPLIINNNVHKQLRKFIQDYGEDVGLDQQESTLGATVLAERNELNGNAFPVSYLGGAGRFEAVTLAMPEYEAIEILEDSAMWPEQFAVACDHGDSDSMTLWRYFTDSDMQRYEDAVEESDRDLTGDRRFASIKFLTANGVPDNFMIVRSEVMHGAIQFCAPIRGLEIQALVLENTSTESIRVERFTAAAYEGALRTHAATDEAIRTVVPYDEEFWIDVWKPGQKIIVPLRIMFTHRRDVSYGDLADCGNLADDWCLGAPASDEKPTPFRGLLPPKTVGPCPSMIAPLLPKAFDYGYTIDPISLTIANLAYPIRDFEPLRLAMVGNYAIGSCPHLFRLDPATDSWTSKGNVLRGAVGKDAKRTDLIEIDDANVQLELRELENELSIIDRAELTIQFEDGTMRALQSVNPALRAEDNLDIRLDRGDRIPLTFNPINSDREVKQSWLRITGYYVPYGSREYRTHVATRESESN